MEVMGSSRPAVVVVLFRTPARYGEVIVSPGKESGVMSQAYTFTGFRLASHGISAHWQGLHGSATETITGLVRGFSGSWTDGTVVENGGRKMRVDLFVFSGTGNTLKNSKRGWEEIPPERGWEVNLNRMEKLPVSISGRIRHGRAGLYHGLLFHLSSCAGFHQTS